MYFNITAKEGLNFSKLSGDNNPIHLNDTVGYNSLFGEKICHGCLVIIKFFNLINLEKIIKNKKKYFVKIIFFRHFSYQKKISIVKKKNCFFFYQSQLIIAELKINFRNEISNFDLDNYKNFKIDIKKNKLSKNKNISLALCNLSKYVGTIYPGENSIIREITVNYNNKFNFSEKKILIFSKKIDTRFPLIYNRMNYQKYDIEFQTLIRPKLKPNKIIPTKKIKNIVKKMDDKIIIVGAGSGIGKELLGILKMNKKLKIVATYNKNKFLLKNKNIKTIQLDIEKSINKIKNLVNSMKKLKLYYFATPKINLDIKNKEYVNLYKRFYVKYPLDILNSFKGQNIEFFYPSTIYVDKIKTAYSQIKKVAETKLKKIASKNVKVNVLRIDEVNTKQNLSLSNKKLPSFIKLLNKNENYQKKIFFIK